MTCLLVGLFIHYVLKFPFLDSFLMGAIVSSTDAGAVFTVLRSRNIHLKDNLTPLLELESGSNDPMAVFLTTGILQLMQSPTLEITDMIPIFIQQMFTGALLGFTFGHGTVLLFNRIRLEIEGLYIVLSIAMVIFIFSTTQALKGNGFLAVYMAGVILGNRNFVFKKSLSRMHDGISWLMQSAMFLTLGLLIYPSHIWKVAGPGILIALFMILCARPISVFTSLFFSKLNIREKSLVSWVGLRGSVPVILATYPLVAGIERAGHIFNLVFFVILTSLIFQGTSVGAVAKFLKLYVTKPNKKNYPSTSGSLKDIVTVQVPSLSLAIGKSIIDLALPDHKVLIVCIERKGDLIIPRGSTELEANDKIFIMADDEDLGDFVEMLYQTEVEQHSIYQKFKEKINLHSRP